MSTSGTWRTLSSASTAELALHLLGELAAPAAAEHHGEHAEVGRAAQAGR